MGSQLAANMGCATDNMGFATVSIGGVTNSMGCEPRLSGWISSYTILLMASTLSELGTAQPQLVFWYRQYECKCWRKAYLGLE